MVLISGTSNWANIHTTFEGEYKVVGQETAEVTDMMSRSYLCEL